MHRIMIIALMALLAIAGCGSSSSSRAPGPMSMTPRELAELECPTGDVEACTAEITAALDAGQPAALCIGPQSDRWNIVTPAAGDQLESACGPDNGGRIRAFIIAP